VILINIYLFNFSNNFCLERKKIVFEDIFFCFMRKCIHFIEFFLPEIHPVILNQIEIVDFIFLIQTEGFGGELIKKKQIFGGKKGRSLYFY